MIFHEEFYYKLQIESFISFRTCRIQYIAQYLHTKRAAEENFTNAHKEMEQRNKKKTVSDIFFQKCDTFLRHVHLASCRRRSHLRSKDEGQGLKWSNGIKNGKTLRRLRIVWLLFGLFTNRLSAPPYSRVTDNVTVIMGTILKNKNRLIFQVGYVP